MTQQDFIYAIFNQVGAISFPLRLDSSTSELVVKWNALLALADIRNPVTESRRTVRPRNSEKELPSRIALRHRISDGPLLVIDEDDIDSVSLRLVGGEEEVIIDGGSFIAEGCYGRVYRFDLPNGPVAVKIQHLDLKAAYYPQSRELTLCESLLEPVALCLIQNESPPDIQEFFPQIYGSFVFRKDEELVSVIVEQFIDGQTLARIQDEDQLLVGWEKLDNALANINQNTTFRVRDLDVAESNVILTPSHDIVFVDHGYTTIKTSGDGWVNGQVQSVKLY